MTLEHAIIDQLVATNAVSAIIGSGSAARIRPNKLDEADALPAIRYAVISKRHEDYIRGTMTLTYAELQLDCYAATYLAAKGLAAAVRVAMTGLALPGAVQGLSVWDLTLENEMDGYEPPADASDIGRHKVTMQYQISFDEANT